MQPQSEQDRRQFKRFEIKVFGTMNSFTVALEKGVFLDCSLLNISQGGVKVRINSSRKKLPEIQEGQRIHFRSFLDERHIYLEGRSGAIAWADMQNLEFGVTFDDTLPVDSFLEYLDT